MNDDAQKMVQCTRCFGRGYLVESRKSGRGFYARSCPGCGGCGQRPERTRKVKPR